MKTAIPALIGTCALGLGLPVVAHDTKSDHMMMSEHEMMMSMDTNKDGMVSKVEYMKHHEQMWMKMKKNDKGMVELKSMDMMKDGKMMKDDKMMKDGMPNKDKMSGDKM
ncbi:MAG: hypothetical protein ABIX37_00640 [Gammaproteobacteria bacterium]